MATKERGIEMNKEIVKAMEKKDKRFSKWLRKNGYKIMRVLLFFIWIPMWFDDKLNARQKWSEERANKILSYYIPRNSEWDASKNCFYFFDNGLGWSAKKKVKWRDRRWWKRNCRFFGGKIRSYLISTFELEGFKKEVLETENSTTEIIFYLNTSLPEEK